MYTCGWQGKSIVRGSSASVAFFCTCNPGLCALMLHWIQVFNNNYNCNTHYVLVLIMLGFF